jgi:hypothetical protein
MMDYSVAALKLPLTNTTNKATAGPAQGKKGPTLDIKKKKNLVADEDNQGGKNIKCSSFVCLFNTNYRPKDKEELQQFFDQFPDVMAAVLTHGMFMKIITVLVKIDTDPTGKKTMTTRDISPEEYEEDIRHIRTRFNCEVGYSGKGRRFHIHLNFFIVHTTKIQIELKPLVEAINVELEARSLPLIKYFHTKSEKPASQLYMKKLQLAQR